MNKRLQQKLLISALNGRNDLARIRSNETAATSSHFSQGQLTGVERHPQPCGFELVRQKIQRRTPHDGATQRSKDRRQLVAPDDWSMSRTMMSYWINFARTGNPNGTGLAPWQPYSTARPELLHLTLDPRMAPVPHMDKLQVLDAHFQRRRELARRL